MGRASFGPEADKARLATTRRLGAHLRGAGECDDEGFTSVFGSRRGAAAMLDGASSAAPASADAVARRERLADAGGIAAILRRASLHGATPSSGTELHDELSDVADEFCEAAFADGVRLRAHLAEVLDVPEVAEVGEQRARWDIHRSVLRNCIKHDEAWLRQRAVIAHDKEVGRQVERFGVSEGRMDWLELTAAETQRIETRADYQSGKLPMRGDWPEFVPQLRATRDAERMTRADLRLLWVQHVSARFGRAVARRQAITRAALRG